MKKLKRLNNLLLFTLCAAMVPAFPQTGTQAPVNLQQMRNDIQIFEAILDQALDQVFSNPFALVERAKGAYLADYGATFTFLINIKAATMETPFGTIRRPESADPKLREQKVEELRQRIVNILGSYGNAIGQLRETDAVAVVAHVVDQNFSTKTQNKTIIIKVLKRDLIVMAARQTAAAEFRKKVHIVEY
jgi:hypothetical protein